MSDLTSDSTSSASSSSNGVVAAPFWQRVTMKQVALGTAVVALVLLGLFLLIALRNVVVMLFLGIVVATALTPIVERLRRLGLSQGPATLAAFMLLILLVGALVAALVPFIATQIIQVVGDLPERYAGLRGSIAASPSAFVQNLAAQMPADPFQNMTSGDGFALGATLSALVPSLGRLLLLGSLVLFLSYYWLYYRAL